MNLYSRLYRLGLVSLTLAIPLNIVLLADKTQSISAQPESQFQETLRLGDVKTKQVLLTQLDVTGDPDPHFSDDIDAIIEREREREREREEAIAEFEKLKNEAIAEFENENPAFMPILRGTNYMFVVRSSLADYTRYIEVTESGDDLIAELTLESTTASFVPIIIVIFEDEGEIYEFEVYTESESSDYISEDPMSIAIRVDTQQKRFYVAYDHVIPLHIGIVGPDVARNIPGEIEDITGSIIDSLYSEPEQIVYFNYNTWSDGVFQGYYSLDSVSDQQNGLLNLDSSADVEYDSRHLSVGPVRFMNLDNDGSGDLQSPE